MGEAEVSIAEECLKRMSSEQEVYEHLLKGMRLKIFPQVFSPKYSSSAENFIELLEKALGHSTIPVQSFCEVGVGTGAVLLHFVKSLGIKGLGIDINPEAVKNTQANIELHELAHLAEVFHRDVFGLLHWSNTFDCIFWNIPFIKVHPLVEHHMLSDLERAIKTSYEPIEAYMREACRYTTEHGRVFLGFCKELGDEEELFASAQRAHANLILVDEMKKSFLSYQLYEVLSRSPSLR